MSITNEQRYDLHQALDEKLGRKDAAVLMEHLPPVGWADVATKQDLDAQTALLAAELRGDMMSMERRFWLETRRLDQGIAGLRTDMEAGFRRLQTRTLTALVGIAGLVLSSAVMFR